MLRSPIGRWPTRHGASCQSCLLMQLLQHIHPHPGTLHFQTLTRGISSRRGGQRCSMRQCSVSNLALSQQTWQAPCTDFCATVFVCAPIACVARVIFTTLAFFSLPAFATVWADAGFFFVFILGLGTMALEPYRYLSQKYTLSGNRTRCLSKNS